jgi:rare lipoprotein A
MLGHSLVPSIQNVLHFFRGDLPNRKSKTIFVMSLLVIGQILASCGGKNELASENGSESLIGPNWSQTGQASWYGPGFYGNRTASGEIFRPGTITAAHKSLPFGTKVCVANLYNGRNLIVTINDRGPFIPGRIIDLAQGAAALLGVTSSGVASVRLTLAQSGCSGAVNAPAVAANPKVECAKQFLTEVDQDDNGRFMMVTKADKCTASKVIATFVDQKGKETKGSAVLFGKPETRTVRVPLPESAQSVRVDLMWNSEVYASSKTIPLESAVQESAIQEPEVTADAPPTTAKSPPGSLEEALRDIPRFDPNK